MQQWTDNHTEYLKALRETCDALAIAHLSAFQKLKHRQRYFRIPTIVLGTLSGSASFGTGTFPAQVRHYVPMAVGVVSLGIAIVQGLESYYKISERMAGHYTASQEFGKLHEDITIELSLSPHERASTGLSFVRGVYERFEKTIATGPYLKTLELSIINARRRSLSLGLICPPTTIE